MAYWLASERDGQQSTFIQRFDPRFWTINFPRPMMGSVTTMAPDALRVDVEFYHTDALAGLIWESADRFDHPLLSYDTDRDYSRTTLRFRWRSSGVIALNAVHGPTLTIEGHDAAGEPRSWFIRLWNYAIGSAQDAEITLPFSDLREGWDISGNPPTIPVGDIDRMFISLTPPGYDPASHALLSSRRTGWAELTGISCDGDRSMLPIGDIMLPPHDLRMATAFDDSYNLTPERMLRNMRGLGYREDVVHYLGMSHFFLLTANAAGDLLVTSSGFLSIACIAWHASFLSLCKQQGYSPILSLSYELFDEHCPEEWKQRYYDGTPALTGWDPPSTLLSPTSSPAMLFLRATARRFIQLLLAEDMPVRFQIGEPWWWVSADRRICLYDDTAKAIFGTSLGDEPPDIPDLGQPLSPQQKALLDQAGVRLASSTANLRNLVMNEAGGNAEVHLLVFTPTILDPATPEVRRANLPAGWAWPNYGRLQLEDYDWLTAGAEALRRKAYTFVQQHLGYPLAAQDYLSGFVLDPQDAEQFWQKIDAGIEEAKRRGVPRQYVWALPQVLRDGYTRLPATQDDMMQAFDDVLYPLALGRDAGVSPEFSTSVTLTASGHERRSSQWTDARLRFDVGPGIRSEQELGVLIAFFRARRGAARGFRLPDPFDFSSNGMTGTPTPLDQLIGIGNGLAATFQLRKLYGSGPEPQERQITRPRAETIRLSVDNVETAGWHLEAGGRIVFEDAPASGAQIKAGFLFDVPVRFAEDRLDITGAAFAAGEAPSVPLIEVREAA